MTQLGVSSDRFILLTLLSLLSLCQPFAGENISFVSGLTTNVHHASIDHHHAPLVHGISNHSLSHFQFIQPGNEPITFTLIVSDGGLSSLAVLVREMIFDQVELGVYVNTHQV